MNYEEIKTAIKEEFVQKLDFTSEISEEELKEDLEQAIVAASKNQYMSLADQKRMTRELFDAIRRLDILEELIRDESITEIMVNGPSHIFIEKKGKLFRYEKQFESKDKLSDIIQQIVSTSNRVVNESMPIVDSRLAGGARVNVVLNPIAINGPILTIRRFPDKPILMEDLIAFGSVSVEAAEFLKKLVIGGYNIFISGGTGSGKTTFLNALSQYIPRTERVITIEDSAELQLLGIDNLVRLETRNANMSGCDAITIRDLIKASLRMRPDRIIVGEVRGSEAIDMLQALNTGHDGSLSTGHANSCNDMFTRLETMVLMGMDLPLMAIRRQIASGIDIVVHLGRLRDRSRKVLEITEVLGFENGEIQSRILYQFEESAESTKTEVIGELKKCGELCQIQKLQFAGII